MSFPLLERSLEGPALLVFVPISLLSEITYLRLDSLYTVITRPNRSGDESLVYRTILVLLHTKNIAYEEHPTPLCEVSFFQGHEMPLQCHFPLPPQGDD